MEAATVTMIGYARVSTPDQCINLQMDALEEAGCDHVFRDEGVSAKIRKRRGFLAAMDMLDSGDQFVVWKMDRAFRSVIHASAMLEEFVLEGIQLVCLTEPLDIFDPKERCYYYIRSAISELERIILSERTKAGMEAARKRGAKIGRPRKLSPWQVQQIKAHLDQKPDLTHGTLADRYGVSIRTILRVLQEGRF